MSRYVSTTGFRYRHPETGAIVSASPVELPDDSWTESQVNAGYVRKLPDPEVPVPVGDTEGKKSKSKGKEADLRPEPTTPEE